jgi:hypothetical protein
VAGECQSWQALRAGWAGLAFSLLYPKRARGVGPPPGALAGGCCSGGLLFVCLITLARRDRAVGARAPSEVTNPDKKHREKPQRSLQNREFAWCQGLKEAKQGRSPRQWQSQGHAQLLPCTEPAETAARLGQGKQTTRSRTKEGPTHATGHCSTAPLSLAKQSEK